MAKALSLSTKIRIKITDQTETLVDASIISRKLRRRDQKIITELVTEAQRTVEDNPLEALDEIEEAAKQRFTMQISGEDKDMETLIEFAEDYGYTLLIQEIDSRVEEANGKGK